MADRDILTTAVSQALQVELKGRERARSLVGYNVNIHASVSRDREASSKVRVSTFTNQNWEINRFHGNTVACSNEYLAYVLSGRNGACIRIIQLDKQNRTLLKKFTGEILDIAFASTKSNILGAVDEGGNIFVYDFDIANGEITKICNCLKLHIFHGTIPDGKPHRLVWCPNISQQSDDDDDDNLVLAVSSGSRVEIFDLPEITTRYSLGIALDFAKIDCGVTYITEAHSGCVTDMKFSPDAHVLATSGEDGHLKFWQLSQQDTAETTKCLHDYEPHDGQIVTRLMFLDNYLSQDSSAQFWRFLITASKHNSEVKIWCTVNWKCLQTIRFLPSLEQDEHPNMLLALDLSASYLIAADSVRPVLYVIPVSQDSTSGSASFSSITEYILTQPVLSFVISGHTSITLSEDESSSSDEQDNDITKFNPHHNIVQLKIHCIQTRSMQELLVTFEPPDLMGIPPDTPIDTPPDSSTDILPATTDISTDIIPAATDISIDILPAATDILLAATDILPAATDISTDILPAAIDIPMLQGQSMNPPPDYNETATFDFAPVKHSVTTPTDHTQYGPGQSSPAVKLMSPILFSVNVAQPLSLRSPSDFSHTSQSHDEIVTSLSEEGGAKSGSMGGVLVTLPINRSISDNENDEKVIVTPTTPTLPGELTTPFPSALTEKHEDEWPSLDAPPIPPPTVRDVRVLANEIVLSVVSNAVSVIEQEYVQNNNIQIDSNRDNEQSSTGSNENEEHMQEIIENDNILCEDVIAHPSYSDDNILCEDVIAHPSYSDDNKLLLQVIDQIHQQNQEIESLKSYQQEQLHDLQTQFENNMESLTKQTTNEINELFREQNQRIEKLIKSLETKRTEKLTQSLTQTFQTSVAGRLEKTVKNETKNTLLPSIQKSLSSSQENISRTINEQLIVSVNAQLQEILHTDGLIQSISNSISGSLQHLLPSIMESLYTNTILPSFERSCQQMFVQLDEAFRQGTRDYLVQIHEQQTRTTFEPLVQQLSGTVQNLMASFTTPNSPVVQLVHSCVHKELSTLQPKLQESLKDSLVTAIKSELENVIDNKLVSANTSISFQQQQEQLIRLIQEKRYDTAFNIALSTSNLQLVTYLCSNASPEEVFDTNSQCPLTQPVLLSLIQQVAVDLSDEIELKVRYLEHAIMSLDPDDHITSSHLPNVMQLLSDQLMKMEDKLKKSNQGTAQLFRAMKRVRMLSEHICSKATAAAATGPGQRK